MNKSLIKKFSLKNKKAFIFGGCGLIGSEVAKIFIEAGAKVMVFDENIKYGKKLEKKYLRQNFKFINTDISDLKNIDNEFNNFIKKYGCPEIFVNCSYPVTGDWAKSTFDENSLQSLKKC